MTMRQAAADELAFRLKRAADELAGSGMRPKRVRYSHGQLNGLIKPRSPKGFVLTASPPTLLLPDGRLWYFHQRLRPEGIYYDARVDHRRSQHGSIPVGSARFSFLGAVVDSYNFGFKHDADLRRGYELGAVFPTESGALEFVSAAEALAAIVASVKG